VEVALVPGWSWSLPAGERAVIVRGLRAVSDFEFELQMASTKSRAGTGGGDDLLQLPRRNTIM